MDKTRSDLKSFSRTTQRDDRHGTVRSERGGLTSEFWRHNLLRKAWPWAAAAASGVLLFLASSPFGWSGLVMVFLQPLFVALTTARSARRAALLSFVAGLAFGCLTPQSLVSAGSWTGWGEGSAAHLDAGIRQQQVRLEALAFGVASLVAAPWPIFGLTAFYFRSRSAGARMAALVAAWVLAEWLRTEIVFGYAWQLSGTAVAVLRPFAQGASLGGVWLLCAEAALLNLSLWELVRSRADDRPRRFLAPCLGVAAVLSLGGWGFARQMSPEDSKGGVHVAIAHDSENTFPTEWFLDFGWNRIYRDMAEEALRRRADAVVLPESTSLFAISLDGSWTSAKPLKAQRPVTDWAGPVHDLLTSPSGLVALGADTVEGGRLHNSVLFWDPSGLIGVYHKRNPVAFAERLPLGVRWFVHGAAEYEAGDGPQLVSAEGVKWGAFICQEVWFPNLTRESVLAGADVLVNPGNDGVFADRHVGDLQLAAARLRAIETGRFVVRAAQGGVSALIDPFGDLVPSGGRERGARILWGLASPRKTLTPYVRYGSWVVVAAVLVLLAFAAIDRRALAETARLIQRVRPSGRLGT